MKTIVVYESYWGNTAAVAWAIAEGIGPEARAMPTSEATGEALAGVGLIVAGSPIVAFALPTEKARRDMAAKPGKAPSPPDLSHPSMRSWLETLPKGAGRAAAFRRPLPRCWPTCRARGPRFLKGWTSPRSPNGPRRSSPI